MNGQEKTMKALGWNAFFEAHREELGLSFVSIARVIAQQRESYTVKNAQGEYRVFLNPFYVQKKKKDHIF